MGHILWPVTRDPRDPSFCWPVTRMTRDPVPDHGWSRWQLLTNHDEFTTLPSLLCTDVQSGNGNAGYGLFGEYFIVCKGNLAVYTLYTAIFTSWTRWTVLLIHLHVYTLPNHGSSVLRHWPVTHMTHSHLLTHVTHDYRPIVCSEPVPGLNATKLLRTSQFRWRHRDSPPSSSLHMMTSLPEAETCTVVVLAPGTWSRLESTGLAEAAGW